MSNYNPKLDRKLKKFVKHSIKHFNQRHPNFKRNKVAAYKMVKPYVKLPKRYFLIRESKKFNLEKLKTLPDNFVIKSITGGGSRQVICAQRDIDLQNQTLSYSDLLHKKYHLSEKQFLTYVRKMMKSGSFLVEQFLGAKGCSTTKEDGIFSNGKVNIPYDYKLFVTQGKVTWIGVFDRNITTGKGYLCFYDRNWRYYPKDQIFVKFGKYEPFPPDKIPSLPSEMIQRKLIYLAEKLSKIHQTYFARYDFYVIDETIYFGEITIASGCFLYHKVTPLTINKVYPKHLRKSLKL